MQTEKQSLIVDNVQSTVVAEYTPEPRVDTNYQSEANLEQELIRRLEQQAYEYVKIRNENDLIQNLRKQLEKLNNFQFSDTEWDQFFREQIAAQNQTIEDKTRTIQEDFIKNLKRDDGTIKNIYLLKKDNIHYNTLQVINQYETASGKRTNRYDVTILVNGLPMVHIELKRRGVAIVEAFNQINRYKDQSFWADSGLFEYVQLFVISNGTHTKYYSNTTRAEYIEKTVNNAKWKQWNSFEKTIWWADANNKTIADLTDFTKTFFQKHTLLNILTKYCVFTVDKKLLVMRPYQIVATEKIIETIQFNHNAKKFGKNGSGGYVWHTTGSGKTLTSFKTAQLVTQMDFVKKVIFVVDRKDLDYQTQREYDKFQKWAANGTSDTQALKVVLEDTDPKRKIIITTIQKLSQFIKKNTKHPIFQEEIVMIFDECHRSQFGKMHGDVVKYFKKYYLFGFTGTPIFATNATDIHTTEQIFGRRLHTYNIIDAINDKTVLPFKVDYFSTVKSKEILDHEAQVEDIDTERILSDPRRITNVVQYILQNFDRKTHRNTKYSLDNKRIWGFNSIFAVSSIEMAKIYYQEFQKQMQNVSQNQQLKVAVVFSSGPVDEIDGMIDENPEDTKYLSNSNRDFLESAIRDYNQLFGTTYDTTTEKFKNYTENVGKRMKNREIDLLIVVNMFLTGFDAPTLNTLWVDKPLKMHGLIQAFSRTNRILNSVKNFGNIVCFRNLEKQTNEAISLFGNRDAKGIVIIRSYQEYYEWYEQENGLHEKGYVEYIDELQKSFPIHENIIWEEKQKQFITLFGSVLRVKNLLSVFPEFVGNEILTERDFQDYQSKYLDLYQSFRGGKREKEEVNDELVFEMELIKQVDINIDFILKLIQEYSDSNCQDTALLENIQHSVDSSISLRNKKDLIETFLQNLNGNADVDTMWNEFVEEEKLRVLNEIIEDENLKKDDVYRFMQDSFQNCTFSENGPTITKLMNHRKSRFEKNDTNETAFSEQKERVTDRLRKFFEKFFGIVNQYFSFSRK